MVNVDFPMGIVTIFEPSTFQSSKKIKCVCICERGGGWRQGLIQKQAFGEGITENLSVMSYVLNAFPETSQVFNFL